MGWQGLQWSLSSDRCRCCTVSDLIFELWGMNEPAGMFDAMEVVMWIVGLCDMNGTREGHIQVSHDTMTGNTDSGQYATVRYDKTQSIHLFGLGAKRPVYLIGFYCWQMRISDLRKGTSKKLYTSMGNRIIRQYS